MGLSWVRRRLVDRCTIILCLGLLTTACQPPLPTSYEGVVQEIHAVTPVYELISPDRVGRVAIAPAMQGKVLTSTYTGLTGHFNGWLNMEAWRAKPNPTTNIGGEDRLWIGPLGSQYSFYYQQIEPLDEENWQVPTPLREGAYEMIEHDDHQLLMQKRMQLTNFMGTAFDVCVIRQIKMIDRAAVSAHLGIKLDRTCQFVAFESLNHLINTGHQTWEQETGLAGLWSLSMINGTDSTVVSIPLDSAVVLQRIYQYLGPLDARRLHLQEGQLRFKADGKYRSKIGVPAEIAPRIYGCYTPEHQRLTIIQFSKGTDSLYFNSKVGFQQNPYEGEAISVYNHGRMDEGEMDENAFYELESASALRPLAPGDRLAHFHRVYHFSGSPAYLATICQQVLKTDLVNVPPIFATP